MLWAETYDAELTSVLGVQEQIAGSIVNALQARLVGQVAAPVPSRRATADTAAYELYLKGRYVFNTHGGGEGILQAAGYFEQAVARDPSYAAAYAGLSDAYTRLAVFGYGPPRETFAKATAAARHARTGRYPRRGACLAGARRLRLRLPVGRGGARIPSSHRAGPGYVRPGPFAICLACQGRYEEAIAQLEIGRVMDRSRHRWATCSGRVLVCAGRPDDAIRILRQVLDLNPRSDQAFRQLGHAYLQKGMAAEAIAAFRQAAALEWATRPGATRLCARGHRPT